MAASSTLESVSARGAGRSYRVAGVLCEEEEKEKKRKEKKKGRKVEVEYFHETVNICKIDSYKYLNGRDSPKQHFWKHNLPFLIMPCLNICISIKRRSKSNCTSLVCYGGGG